MPGPRDPINLTPLEPPLSLKGDGEKGFFPGSGTAQLPHELAVSAYFSGGDFAALVWPQGQSESICIEAPRISLGWLRRALPGMDRRDDGEFARGRAY
jgi:hypothetical protein